MSSLFVASRKIALSLALAGVLGFGVASAKELPRVLIIATGGTIAGVANNNSATGYDAGKVKVDDLINAVPKIQTIAQCDVEQFCNIASQNMDCATWVKLSERVNKAFAEQHYDGIVITHGTDTMEETAYFLENTLNSGHPVVFVGSMRPTTAISPDGPENLYNAVEIAVSPKSLKRGVLVALNGKIFESRDVFKNDMNNTDAFDTRYGGKVGRVDSGGVEYFSNHIGGERPYWRLKPGAELPRVDIIHAYAGCTGDTIDTAVANGAKGIVIAGTGNGNTSDDALEAMKRAVAKGVKVVRSSRVPHGYVNRNHEVNDDEMGTLASYDLSPEHARIILQLMIYRIENENCTLNNAEMQRYFENDYFGN